MTRLQNTSHTGQTVQRRKDTPSNSSSKANRGNEPANKRTGANRRNTAKERKERQAKVTSAPPPVMARSYNMETPLPAKRTYNQKARRRFDVALNVPGAEMRLPSLPIFRVNLKLLSLGLVIALLGALYYLWNAPFFQVKAAVVEGAAMLKASDVNAVLGVSGESIFSLHASELQKELQNAFPEFSTVSVDVSLPDKVIVRVTERTPVLTWRQGGADQLVDQAGYAFPMRLGASTLITPVVESAGAPPALGISTQDIAALVADSSSFEAEQTKVEPTVKKDGDPSVSTEKTASSQPLLQPEMVSAILAISKVIPANLALLYDPQHGLGWQDERGWKVYFGDSKDIDMKLKVYDAIVSRLIDEEAQPTFISVEHVHNPYFRVEQ